ncbi:hypothetical protein RhiirA4_450447 [Rhizophagus irregularis]|uniref:BACK domain-containing protein n=1 Tax=Rhizophagus irregularis TaxID=588596 RepID=A0A2I1FT54_9GLOM|nr:hypothetical protein RhiirA4_450447 [Rhizophagus irregularis]
MNSQNILTKLSQNLLNDEEYYDVNIEVGNDPYIRYFTYLRKICQSIKGKSDGTLASWMEQNFSLIYQTSFENDSFLELQKFCTNLITNKIFRSPSFSLIPEKLLVSLIQSVNLQINEIQVWEHVLKWGIAQSPELPSDPTNFSKEDFRIYASVYPINQIS